MDDNKDCVPLGKQVCVISTWLQVGAGELWKKDSWFGFGLMVPAKKSPRRAFVGGGVMTDDESESERKVSFEFNIKNQKRRSTT